MDFKGKLEKLMSKKNIVVNLIIILLCGVLLILLGDISGSMASKNNTSSSNALEVNKAISNTNGDDAYAEMVKQELSDTLSKIDGVGKTYVMIYFEGSSRTVPAININDSNSKSEEKDTSGGKRVTTENNKNQNVVIINENGESKPLVLRQNYPPITGVIIVAEGAYNSVVKERILDAVKTALNLNMDKISIMPMGKNLIK